MRAEDGNEVKGQLHVLVVDNDASALQRVCERLTAEGHRATACAQAIGLGEVIAHTRPDVVLVDVLMPNLTGTNLHALLARYPLGSAPAMVLHSSVPTRILRAVVDVEQAAGVVHKTSSDIEFFFAFNAILDRVQTRGVDSSAQVRASSGTHRIAANPARIGAEQIALKTGPSRR